MRTFSTLILLLISLIAFSQDDFSFVTHKEWTNYRKMAINDERIIAVGSTGSCDAPFLYVLDKETGAVLLGKSTQQFSGQYGTYTDVEFDEDGTFWAVGWMRSGDDVIGGFKAILDYYDAEGNLLQAYHYEDELAEENKSFIEVLSDGQVLWSTGEYLVRINNDGEIVDTTSFSSIKGLTSHDYQTFAIASDSSFTVYSVEDYSTYFMTDSLEGAIEDVNSGLGQYYWLIGDQLHGVAIGNTEDYVKTIPFEADKISIPADTAKVLVYQTSTDIFSENKVCTYFPHSENFGTVETWTYPKRTLTQLEILDGKYYHLGTNYFEPLSVDRNMKHGFIRRSENISPLDGPDIAITDIEVELSEFLISTLPSGLIFAGPRWDVNVSIRNYGEEFLEFSHIISTKAYGGFNCAEGRDYYRIISNFEASDIITYNTEYVEGEFSSEPPEGAMTLDLSVCFFVAAPDNQLDANPEDNYFCVSHTEDIIISDVEMLEAKSGLKLFPNPASNFTYLEFEAQNIDQLIVYDALGQVVYERIGRLESPFQLDTSDLLPGMYSLFASAGNNQWVKRLIVK